MYASKVVAMVDAKERLDFPDQIGLMFKRKIRHLFDIYLLANDVLNGKSTINKNIFRSLVILFGMTRIKKFAYFRGNSIGSYSDKDIRDELRSVVPKGVPIPSVEEMKWTVRKFFDMYVFNWTLNEHRFVEDFTSKNFRPEDIFGKKVDTKKLHSMYYYKEILGKVQSIK